MKKIINILLVIILSIMLLIALTGCSNETEVTQSEDEKESSVIEKVVENKTEGKLSEIITSKNYGESVNYLGNNFDEWKIFYNDGKNVFLIAANNIPYTYVPIDLGLVNKSATMTSYEVYWDHNDFKYTGTAEIKSEVADKFMFKWSKEYPNSEIYTAKSAASLLDTDKWAGFVDTTVADSAIGSPTVDMFIESWNQAEEEKIYYNKSNEYGYFIDNVKDPEDYDFYMYNKPEIEEGKGNELYVVKSNLPFGYWLVAPSAKGEEWMVAVNKYGMNVDDSWSIGNGLRPVVCLNAETKGKFVDGAWNLNK